MGAASKLERDRTTDLGFHPTGGRLASDIRSMVGRSIEALAYPNGEPRSAKLVVGGVDVASDHVSLSTRLTRGQPRLRRRRGLERRVSEPGREVPPPRRRGRVGYKSSTQGRARAGSGVSIHRDRMRRFPGTLWASVVSSGRPCLSRRCLVMKGSQVRVRASALQDLQRFSPTVRKRGPFRATPEGPHVSHLLAGGGLAIRAWGSLRPTALSERHHGSVRWWADEGSGARSRSRPDPVDGLPNVAKGVRLSAPSDVPQSFRTSHHAPDVRRRARLDRSIARRAPTGAPTTLKKIPFPARFESRRAHFQPHSCADCAWLERDRHPRGRKCAPRASPGAEAARRRPATGRSEPGRAQGSPASTGSALSRAGDLKVPSLRSCEQPGGCANDESNCAYDNTDHRARAFSFLFCAASPLYAERHAESSEDDRSAEEEG